MRILLTPVSCLKRRAYEKAASGVCVCRGARRGTPPRLAKPDARATGRARFPIDNDDLGGTVTGPKGPEAGVWVIAETSDLPTKFVKIVVTDDRGRYLIPDLPKASYNVWVRGYGLVDSPKTQTVAGKIMNLTAVPAPNPRAAARVLPGRILVLPDESARQERVPRHRRYRQRHLAGDAVAGAVASVAQVRRLHGVPSDRHQGNARNSEGARARSPRPSPHGSGAFSRDRPAAR